MLAEKRFQMFENLCTRQIYCILIKGVLKIKHYYELFSLCQCEQIKEEKKNQINLYRTFIVEKCNVTARHTSILLQKIIIVIINKRFSAKSWF